MTRESELSRREVLRAAGIAGAGLLLPTHWAGRTDAVAQMTGGGGMTGGGPPSPFVAPFSVPLPVVPVAAPTRPDNTTDYYEITIQENEVQVLPGLATTIWGFNGQFPGPTIRGRQGRPAVVRFVNDLSLATPAIHLHGGNVPPESDGYPTDVIPRGSFRDYHYPNQQLGATLSYHDHEMHRTGRNVYMGLFGAYLLDDGFEVDTGLNLPQGDNDVVLIIQDRRFNADGSLNYAPDMIEGALGDVIVVNGRPQPYFEVADRRYRFRIVNGSNARGYQLALSTGQSLRQIASDGGLLPSAVSRRSVTIWPGERVEVIVDFSQVAVGSQVVLKNLLGSGRTADIMRFDVVRHEPDTSSAPTRLRPVERLAEAGAGVTRDFSFDFTTTPLAWTINGQVFDPDRVDADPILGSTEIWRFTTPTVMPHPVHLHLVMFQVLDRNGRAPAPAEAGWKDTVIVNHGEVVRVIARFGDYTGRYVFHCHNLEHEDHMMMSQFEVRGSVGSGIRAGGVAGGEMMGDGHHSH